MAQAVQCNQVSAFDFLLGFTGRARCTDKGVAFRGLPWLSYLLRRLAFCRQIQAAGGAGQARDDVGGLWPNAAAGPSKRECELCVATSSRSESDDSF